MIVFDAFWCFYSAALFYCVFMNILVNCLECMNYFALVHLYQTWDLWSGISKKLLILITYHWAWKFLFKFNLCQLIYHRLLIDSSTLFKEFSFIDFFEHHRSQFLTHLRVSVTASDRQVLKVCQAHTTAETHEMFAL